MDDTTLLPADSSHASMGAATCGRVKARARDRASEHAHVAHRLVARVCRAKPDGGAVEARMRVGSVRSGQHRARVVHIVHVLVAGWLQRSGAVPRLPIAAWIRVAAGTRPEH